MCSATFRSEARGGLILLVIVGMLAAAAVPTWAGITQSGPQFNLKGTPPPPPMAAPGAPGAAARMYERGAYAPPGATNLLATTRAGQPAPVTREKTDVTLSLVAKYGDEKDEDLRKYEAKFEGHYTVRNKKKEQVSVNIFFPYPSTADTLPDARVLVGDHEPDNVRYTQQGVQWESTFDPEEVKDITVQYRAFGTEDFAYMLDRDERIPEFRFALTVSGTERKPQLPARVCLEPSTPLTRASQDWTAEWNYKNLLTSRDIVIVIPPRFMGGNVFQRLDRLTWAGLATVLLFGLILFTGGYATRKPVSMGQYLLIVLALAVFYPLFLYLSKHLRVSSAFWVSYLALAVLVLYNLQRRQGLRFALGYGGFGLALLPGLFTAAALATKGAGALVMIGALLLVAFIMVVAPRVARARPQPPPAPPPVSVPPPGEGPRADEGPAEAGEQVQEAAEPAGPAASVTAVLAAPPTPQQTAGEQHTFCVYCGEELQEDFSFCPHCGKSAEIALRCEQCGTAICLACGQAYRFCPGCGTQLPSLPARPPEPGQ